MRWFGECLLRITLLTLCPQKVLLVQPSFLENLLVYRPQKYPKGNWNLPAPSVEDVHFKSSDDTSLHGWYMPHPHPCGYVLFSHGNGGNVAGWSSAALALRDRHQLSVFLYDYRGYGRSAGSPSEPQIYWDARAARQWLAARASINEQEIIQFGQSLGGAVAVNLAALDGARGLIVARTFSSIRDLVAQKAPCLPIRRIMRHELDSASLIGQYAGPTLIGHGDVDRVIPIKFARQLFEKANEPKRFVLEQGSGHSRTLSEGFHKAIDEYIAALRPARM